MTPECHETQGSPALPPRKEKGGGLFRDRSGSTSSVPELESAAARADSGDKHHREQKWKLIGSHKDRKEARERAASPKAEKKSKTKKASSASHQSGASPRLHPSSSQLSVSSVPGENDSIVFANPVSRQSKVDHPFFVHRPLETLEVCRTYPEEDCTYVP